MKGGLWRFNMIGIEQKCSLTVMSVSAIFILEEAGVESYPGLWVQGFLKTINMELHIDPFWRVVIGVTFFT
jgi:hypothetical protein